MIAQVSVRPIRAVGSTTSGGRVRHAAPREGHRCFIEGWGEVVVIEDDTQDEAARATTGA